MDDLIAWLRQQLDEDERVARAAIDKIGDETLDTWHYEPGEDDRHGGKIRYAQGYTVVHQEDGTPDPDTAEHIARWDPARVLAEIEAKRRILAQYEAVRDEVRDPVSAEHRANARARQFQLEENLRLLVQPYIGRAGWREEWRATPAP